MKYNKNKDEKQLKRRIFAYVSAIIRKSPDGYCNVSQTKLAKMLHLRRDTVVTILDKLVDEVMLTRIAVKNGNRKNPKHFYYIGTPIGTPTNEIISKHLLASNLGEIDMRLIGSSIWGTVDKLDLIDLYLKSGLNVIPLKEGNKIPVYTKKYWNQYFLGKDAKIQQLFRNYPNYNVGCWMPANLVCVDVDYLEDFWVINGGEDYETLKSKGSRGTHYWFIHNGNIGSCNGVRYNEAGEGIMDFKTRESLMVLPPSVHKSGIKYQWTNLVAPAPAPQLIYNLYETRLDFRKSTTKTVNGVIVADPNFATAKPVQSLRQPNRFVTERDTLGEHQRYPQLFRLGRAMRTTSTFEQIDTEIRRLNDIICNPPLPEDRLSALLKHIKYAPDRQDYIQRLQSRLRDLRRTDNMANDSYIPDECERDLEWEHWASIGEALYLQQFEEEYEYFSRVAESNPVNKHWYEAKAWLARYTGE